jgi:hypothetical protein
MSKKRKSTKGLKGYCQLCGSKLENQNEIACKKCQEKCEKKEHGHGRHIAQIMFGCFCTRCGKSWYDDF